MEDVYKNQNMARGKKWWALRERKKTSKATARKRIHTRARAGHRKIISSTNYEENTLRQIHTQRDIPIYAREKKSAETMNKKKRSQFRLTFSI